MPVHVLQTGGESAADHQDHGRTYRWRCATMDAPWRPRDGAGALSFRGGLWLLGGWRPREDGPTGPGDVVDTAFEGTSWTVDSEVWRSDDMGSSWYCVQPQCPWPGRHTAGYTVHQDRMWIIGGDGYTNSADVWSSEDGVEWECHTADAPWAGRVLPYVTSFDGALWLMGGQALQQFAHQGADNAFYRGGGVTTDEFYGDVWRSVDGEHWECILAQAPWGQPGRGAHSSKVAVSCSHSFSQSNSVPYVWVIRPDRLTRSSQRWLPLAVLRRDV